MQITKNRSRDNYQNKIPYKRRKKSEIEEDKFRELNIRNDEINWEQIGIRIEDIDWENNKEISNSENMIKNFLEIIYEICENGIKKKSIGRSKIPKELRKNAR